MIALNDTATTKVKKNLHRISDLSELPNYDWTMISPIPAEPGVTRALVVKGI